MANKIIEIQYRDAVEEELVSSTSRYAGNKMIYYGNLNKMTFKTYKRRQYTKMSAEDRFMVIRAGHEYRPDLVSQEAYGTPDFWWKIMEYNDMKDIMEFKAGVNIVLPSDVLY